MEKIMTNDEIKQFIVDFIKVESKVKQPDNAFLEDAAAITDTFIKKLEARDYFNTYPLDKKPDVLNIINIFKTSNGINDHYDRHTFLFRSLLVATLANWKGLFDVTVDEILKVIRLDLKFKLGKYKHENLINRDVLKQCVKILAAFLPDEVVKAKVTIEKINSLRDKFPGFIINSDEEELIGYNWEHPAATQNIIIPTGITKIGYSAFSDWFSTFSNNTELLSVEIPNTVIYIDQYAFLRCTKLQEIEIPGSVKVIGRDAFTRCDSLEKAIIGRGITELSDRIFYGCENLNTIIMPDYKINIIKAEAFKGCKNLSHFVIPKNVTEIDWSAFADCAKLNNINLPNTLISLGASAFANCTGLTSITLPGNIQFLGDRIFEGCSNLKTVNLGNGLTIISTQLFKDCTSLDSIFIPDSVKTIKYGAFAGCSNLKNITIGKSITSIEEDAFKDISKDAIIKTNNDHVIYYCETNKLNYKIM